MGLEGQQLVARVLVQQRGEVLRLVGEGALRQRLFPGGPLPVERGAGGVQPFGQGLLAPDQRLAAFLGQRQALLGLLQGVGFRGVGTLTSRKLLAGLRSMTCTRKCYSTVLV